MAAANLRSAYLAAWRYGPETEELIATAASRENWSPGEWQRWQEERLARLLHRAATRVPWYRDWWSARRRRGDRSSIEQLANWPILDKESLRANPQAFLADDCDRRQMYAEATSGTTGKPISLWWSRAAVREWFALNELRLRHWHGVTRHAPWAILGGQPIVPIERQRPPFWIWNRPMNQLYLSANHISEQNAPAMIDALTRYGVTHLITYASSGAALARAAASSGGRLEQLRVIITNSEPVLPGQRAALESIFGAPVRETYGMAEIVAAASECPAGRLHLWPDTGVIEVLDDQEDRPTLKSGRLICTGLLNPDMPLIRYAVGDRARPSAPSNDRHSCSCGRTLPQLAGIEGRSNDTLIARDGRRVYWVNPILYGLPLREAQIIQESLDLLRVKCVAAPGFDTAAQELLRTRLRQRMGEVTVKIDLVDSIPRGERGKFRAVVCRLSPEEQRQ